MIGFADGINQIGWINSRSDLNHQSWLVMLSVYGLWWRKNSIEPGSKSFTSAWIEIISDNAAIAHQMPPLYNKYGYCTLNMASINNPLTCFFLQIVP